MGLGGDSRALGSREDLRGLEKLNVQKLKNQRRNLDFRVSALFLSLR